MIPMSQMIGALTNLLVGNGGTNDRVPILKDLWSVRSKAFKVQLSASVAVVALVASVVFFLDRLNPPTAYKHVPPSESAATSPYHSRNGSPHLQRALGNEPGA